MPSKTQIRRVIVGLIILGWLGCLIDGYNHALIMPWARKSDVLVLSLGAMNMELAFKWFFAWLLIYLGVEWFLEN